MRDLKPEDAAGTSDPVVFVEVCGQKEATPVMKKCLSAVFDHTMVFQVRVPRTRRQQQRQRWRLPGFLSVCARVCAACVCVCVRVCVCADWRGGCS